MRQKVDDVAAKLGKQALSRASGDLAQLRTEAVYLEQQVTQSKANETKLLDIVQQVYKKLEVSMIGAYVIGGVCLEREDGRQRP